MKTAGVREKAMETVGCERVLNGVGGTEGEQHGGGGGWDQRQ